MNQKTVMIVGFGVIGRSVAGSLIKNKKIYAKQNLEFKVVAISDVIGSVVDEDGIDLKKILSSDFKKSQGFTKKNTIELIGEIKPDILLELTPGDIKTGEPGISHIKKALKNGVNVVTSNKSPLAVAYGPLMELAEKNSVKLLFEATVGGAIPLLGLQENGVSANKILNVYGVMNGTTNFVLTKMANEGMSLELAVREAQELGYAETDPTYDIDGIDTAAKVVIIANHFMGMDAKFKDVKIEGIRNVTPDSLELANEHGYTIKLIGDALNLEVSPKLIPVDHPLNVADNLNAVLIETDLAGDVTLIGHGAGGPQTSSAIIGDMIQISKG